ncbi:hypothetical protein D3C81_925770 [compost metagenome]
MVALALLQRVVVVLLALGQAVGLRRAGLAGRLVRRAGKHARRGAGVRHRHHGALDHVDVGLLERDRVAFLGHRQRALARDRVLDRLDQVRLHHLAVVDDHRGGLRQLQDGEAVVALPDAQRDGLAVIPLLLLGLAVRLAFPLGRRQDAAAFALDVDAGDLAEAQRLHEIMDAVDAHVARQRVVVRVARMHDRAVHVDPAVAARLVVAEGMVAQREEARVRHAPRRGALAGGQRRQRHERLVGRARRIGAPEGPVQQWLVGRAVKLVPGIGIDPFDEQVGIEGRLGNERQDVAGGRLDCHQRAAAVAVERLGQLLQADVQRQDQVVARRRGRGRQRADRPSAGADFHFLEAGQAVQLGLVALLQADLADVVAALVVVGVLARIVFGAVGIVGLVHGLDPLLVALRDAAQVADHVRGRLAQRVLAEQPRAHVHAGEAEALRGEARHFRIGQLAADRQAFKAARLFHQPLEAAPVARLDLHQRRQAFDGVVQRIGQLGRRDLQRVRRIVARQHDPVAVHDDAAVGLDRRHRDAVVLGLGRVLVMLVPLQPQEAREQQAKADHREQGRGRHADAEAADFQFDVADFGHGGTAAAGSAWAVARTALYR